MTCFKVVIVQLSPSRETTKANSLSNSLIFALPIDESYPGSVVKLHRPFDHRLETVEQIVVLALGKKDQFLLQCMPR